ncbi:MAG: alkaline phosphatase family protein [Candidatus Binatus sp.]|uniref:phospholipase C n=1 Tax=Candidatus Binatus sp. TaxID=2811406 RepID=UPI003C720194
MRKKIARSVAMGLVGLLIQQGSGAAFGPPPQGPPTATPIKHLVVIYPENISFDHYFGTYPVAANPAGEPPFYAKPWTPNVNGLSGALLTNNPNFLNSLNNSTSNTGGGPGAALNPFRLDRSQAATSDQNHDYGPEQAAADSGLMDLFPFDVGVAGPPPAEYTTDGLTMGYYDGNTVTALWNYAQHFAMSDNSYDTTFGPSSPGAINLVSGQTNGAVAKNPSSGVADQLLVGPNTDGSYTLISDTDPTGDVCSTSSNPVAMTGKNIGDLLNAANISWGWFHGGFNLSLTNPNGTTGCKRSTTSAVTGETKVDYITHHASFQYYASTQNLTHARPNVAPSLYGTSADTTSNHQYDTDDFFAALAANNLPAVSFIKPPGFEEGHPGYSDPLDEQAFLVTVLNALQQSPQWSSTAVVISWDDSDGWYDHVMSPILNQSASSADALTGTGKCGNGDAALPGVNPALTHAQGRCGYGPRLPFLVISPFSRPNFVDHTLTAQVSAIRFVEDNWLGGQRIQGSFDAITNSIDSMLDFRRPQPNPPLLLDPSTGEPLHSF